MRSIQQLIQQLNKEGNEQDKRLYDAFKQLDDNVLELVNRASNVEKKNMRYFCRATSESVTVITGGGARIPVILDTTEYPQFGNMHSDTVENTKIWIRRSGVYHISGGLVFNASAAGTYRIINIRVVSPARIPVLDTYIASQSSFANPAGVNVFLNIATHFYCYEGDYVELVANQNSGANINIQADPPRSPYLAVVERMEDIDPSEYGLLDPNANMR